MAVGQAAGIIQGMGHFTELAYLLADIRKRMLFRLDPDLARLYLETLLRSLALLLRERPDEALYRTLQELSRAPIEGRTLDTLQGAMAAAIKLARTFEAELRARGVVAVPVGKLRCCFQQAKADVRLLRRILVDPLAEQINAKLRKVYIRLDAYPPEFAQALQLLRTTDVGAQRKKVAETLLAAAKMHDKHQRGKKYGHYRDVSTATGLMAEPGMLVIAELIGPMFLEACARAQPADLQKLFRLIAGSDPCLNNRFEQILKWAGELMTGIDTDAFSETSILDPAQSNLIYGWMDAYFAATGNHPSIATLRPFIHAQGNNGVDLGVSFEGNYGAAWEAYQAML